MSRIKKVVVLLVLCAAGGLAQNGADAQSQVRTTSPKMIRVAGAVMVGLVEHRAVPEYPSKP